MRAGVDASEVRSTPVLRVIRQTPHIVRRRPPVNRVLSPRPNYVAKSRDDVATTISFDTIELASLLGIGEYNRIHTCVPNEVTERGREARERIYLQDACCQKRRQTHTRWLPIKLFYKLTDKEKNKKHVKCCDTGTGYT